MKGESDPQELGSKREIVEPKTPFMIIRNWDKSLKSLIQIPGLNELADSIGLSLETITSLLNTNFPEDIEYKSVDNDKGEKIEDLATNLVNINSQQIEYLDVIAYPNAANPDPKILTQFEEGGEVILITEGEADITYANSILDDSIPKDSLITERVKKGDLIISSNIPNNWRRIYGESFRFKYFIGNPNGIHKYSDVKKRQITVK